jgi:V/A-type H+-transporting ATPase subunit C
MSDFDYGNARLRVMKSRLLPRRELEALAEVGSLQGLIAALSRTSYRKSIDAALARSTGMECIHIALRDDLVDVLGKARRFFLERAGTLVAVVLQAYDVHNLKAILRGLGKYLSPAEIQPVLLPVGDISFELLEELLRAPGPRGVIDLLASLNLSIAQPLMKLRVEHPDAEIYEMELALEQWYFKESQSLLQSLDDQGKVLTSALNLDADLANILSLLRFVHTPAERDRLQERLGTDDFSRLFVGPGSLAFEQLERLGSLDSLDALVDSLSASPFGAALRSGLEAFERSGRLSDFEIQLKKFRLNWMARWIARDPLGIGVLLGYLALKINEINNIRWIAHGTNMSLSAEAIRAELEFPS